MLQNVYYPLGSYKSFTLDVLVSSGTSKTSASSQDTALQLCAMLLQMKSSGRVDK